MQIRDYRKQARSGYFVATISDFIDVTEATNKRQDEHGKDRFSYVADVKFDLADGASVKTRFYGKYKEWQGRPTAGTMRVFGDLAIAAGLRLGPNGEFDENKLIGKKLMVRVYRDDRLYHKVYTRFAPFDAQNEEIDEIEQFFNDDVDKGYVKLAVTGSGGSSEDAGTVQRDDVD